MRYFWTNKKTTIPALIIGVANLLPLFAVAIPETVVYAITILSVMAIGFFAKDANVTGGTVNQ